MPVQIFDTLKGRKEPLVTRDGGKRLTMYTCGPTVYDSTHAGHLIPPIVGDVVKRYLRSKGYEVKWAHNFTDIEDKIIARAAQEGISTEELASKYIQEYLEVMERLGIDTVDVYPRVSEHLDDIIEMISGLVEKGFAYQVGGDVYFDVTRFPDYGKLSRRTLEELQAGARIEVDARKRHPADFALWKAAKPGEPAWESPWGKGRPGWHIECSVMAAKHLGVPVDLHGGGVDLVFPHHENEIAQSEAYHGKEPFARYWIHNGLLNFQTEKMSKSLGNFVRARDLVEKYGREVLRFYVLSYHYRSPREFGPERLEESRKAWERLQHTVDELRGRLRSWSGERRTAASDRPPSATSADHPLVEAAETAARRFDEAMADDFNTAEALAALFELARVVNPWLHESAGKRGDDSEAFAAALRVFAHADEILGIFRPVGDDERLDHLAANLLEFLLDIREEARRERDWVLADRIRDGLQSLGILVKDTPDGPRWQFREQSR